MAKPAETIFNLGSTHVSAGKFLKLKNNLILEKFDYAELPINPTGEKDWVKDVQVALEELAKSQGLKGEANFILPGNIVLSKTLRVPKVEIEKQRKVVSFELSQKMPFPLDTLLWDFLVIEDDGIEQEILSFAIKPEAVENLIAAIFACGLIPKTFTPGPALDYWAVGEACKNNGEESLVINFGSKSTNLTFISSTGYLLRSLSFGGGQFTDAVASTMGIQSDKAEEVKIKFQNGDKQDAPLQAIQENFFNKYMQEIARSIVTYKRLKKGRTPTKLIITGRTIKNQDLVHNLAQTQMLPIAYFDPFEEVSVADNIDQENRLELPYLCSEQIGLAKQLMQSEHSQIVNLIPVEKVRKLEAKKKLPWLLASAIIFALLPAPWLLNTYRLEKQLLSKEHSQNSEKKMLSKQLTNVQKEVENLEFLKIINKSAKNYISSLESTAEIVYCTQNFLNNLQSIIDSSINQNTWIDELSFMQVNSSNYDRKNKSLEQHAKITGRYLVKPAISLVDLSDEDRKLALIEENGRRQESLTQSISTMPGVEKVTKKIFSIEGDGDLYNRQFTHFSIELILDFKK